MSTSGQPSTDPSSATLMIVRHAEKPLTDGPPGGVDADGHADKHSLTTTGWARAGALVELFASTRNPPPPGLARPDAMYAALHGDGESKRPMQTLIPLAARLGQTINTRFGQGQEASLAAELRTRTGSTLISWEHKAITTIVGRLGPITPTPPTSWPDDRYDVVWVLTADGTSGWNFQQVPQLLLAGDSPDPI
jgi:hypothetical protein